MCLLFDGFSFRSRIINRITLSNKIKSRVINTDIIISVDFVLGSGSNQIKLRVINTDLITSFDFVLGSR